MDKRIISLRDKFEKIWKTAMSNGHFHSGMCLEYYGRLDKYGYGFIRCYVPETKKRKLFKLHRIAYEFRIGPIPKGLYVLHTCDNRRCFNPEHLWIGTAKDNWHDGISKGRIYQKLNGNESAKRKVK